MADQDKYTACSTRDGSSELPIFGANDGIRINVHARDNDGWTALHYSAKNGSYELVKYFADMGTDIHLKTNSGWNILHIAALCGNLNLCKILIDQHNFDVSMKSNEGWTPLHYSARNGSYELITFFAYMGTDIDVKTTSGLNCLHIAALYGHLNLCKTLVNQHNFDMHIADNVGSTAIHFSAEYGNYALFEYFADMGADIYLKRNDRSNCLHYAALKGHLNMCKLLIDKHNFNLDMTDDYGWTALHYSAGNGSYALFNYFADTGVDIYLKTKDERNCLHIAALNGHSNLCKRLIDKHNFDIRMTDNEGLTALLCSIVAGSYELVTYFAKLEFDMCLRNNLSWECLHIAAASGHLNLCMIFINKHNLKVHARDNGGWTALHCSAKNGSYELVKYFADMGTDIHLKTNSGWNILHIAALYGNLNLCKILIDQHNFDVSMKSNEGWTPLHYSARNGSYELITFFAYMGTDIDVKTNSGWNCLHIAALYGHLNLCQVLIDKHKLNIYMTDTGGWTALHYSARNGSYELFKYLAGKVTDIKIKTNDGWNSLHVAALCGHLSLCKTLIEKHNFDVNMTDNEGWTILHHSAKNGHYELIKYFADIGTDIKLKTKLGLSSLHIATLNGHINLCNRLINKHNFDANMSSNQGWAALHYSVKIGSYELFTYLVDMGTDINVKNNLGWNCLHIAAFSGNFDFCKIFIEKYNFDVHETDNDGLTAIHFSAGSGSYKLVTYFVHMGTDIHLKSNLGVNCLHIAALHGHLNLCRELIDIHNFDVHAADNSGWTVLHYSAENGSCELFKYFVNNETDIDLRTNHGSSCLHIAALHGHFKLCQTLIDKHNFDTHQFDNEGWTALHYSVKNGSYELVKYFNGFGADIDLKTNNGRNCLHIAALYGHLDLCKIFLEKYKFDVHKVDNEGFTALHYSASNGSYELVKYFVDFGIDIDLKTNNGSNCLHIAALHGHLDLCKIFVDKHKFDLHVVDNEGYTALHYSACGGSYELVKYFANMGSDAELKSNSGFNCLHIAALNGHLNLCKTLIDKNNVDVQMAGNKGWTALHFSAKKGSYELLTYFSDLGIDIDLKTNLGRNCLHIAAINGHLNLCKTLIDKHNFDIHMADNEGFTALHYSARNGSYELVTYFVDMGTDIGLKNSLGQSCLHIAARNGHVNLCKTLIEKHNFDVHMTDNQGWSALHYSAENGSCELFTYVAAMGADINLEDNLGWNCLHIAALQGHLNLCKTLINKYSYNVHVTDKVGLTALHFSTGSGKYDVVKYFADLGIDIALKTSYGWNCLHLAALDGHFNLCKTLIDKHKFDVHMTDLYGRTALHYSVRNGSFELTSYFADMETNIDRKTVYGQNCLHIAALYGHLNLCKLFVDKYKFDVLSVDNYGWTALHFSARNGSYALVTYFIDMKKTDIHLKTYDGSSCLHIAALYGHLYLCKFFVNNHKFDVLVANNDGRTALHNSAENGNFDLFLFILRKGSEIYSKTNSMKNVLHFAAFNGHLDICKFVLEHFIKDYEYNNTRNQYTLNGKSYKSQVFYKYNTIFLHAMDNEGNTYLHLAAMKNQAKVCELLLKYDSELITLLNKKDETAGDIAKDKDSHKDVSNVLKVEYSRAGMLFIILFF